MNITDCKCPNCNNKLLYIQSKLNGNKVRMASGTVQLQYAIECYWCKFEFGDYNSVSELLDKFNKNYGGDNNVKNSGMES